MEKKPYRESFSVRLPPETLEKLKDMATEEMRSPTNMVEVLIERAARERNRKEQPA